MRKEQRRINANPSSWQINGSSTCLLDSTSSFFKNGRLLLSDGNQKLKNTYNGKLNFNLLLNHFSGIETFQWNVLLNPVSASWYSFWCLGRPVTNISVLLSLWLWTHPICVIIVTFGKLCRLFLHTILSEESDRSFAPETEACEISLQVAALVLNTLLPIPELGHVLEISPAGTAALSHVCLHLQSNFQSRFQLAWEDSQISYT